MTSLTQDAVRFARFHLGGRRGLVLSAVAIVGAGIAFNWGWFVALGMAPLILAVAPCAAMCALGLCMNKMGGQSCSNEPASTAVPATQDMTGEVRPEERIAPTADPAVAPIVASAATAASQRRRPTEEKETLKCEDT